MPAKRLVSSPHRIESVALGSVKPEEIWIYSLEEIGDQDIVDLATHVTIPPSGSFTYLYR